MKRLISEILEIPLFDDDGCTYKEYVQYTYPLDSFVFIAKDSIRQKRALYNKLYDLRCGTSS